jgi:hypothetical protein
MVLLPISVRTLALRVEVFLYHTALCRRESKALLFGWEKGISSRHLDPELYIYVAVIVPSVALA